MIDLICEHLSERRLITTELHVRGPKYRGIVVSAGVKTVAGRDFPPVRDAVERALRDFLSPLKGGREEKGWPRDKPVVAAELLAEAARVDGVSYVEGLLLADATGTAKPTIDINDLELPRVVAVSISEGNPESLDGVLNRVGGIDQDDEGRQIVPIPVIPQEC